MSDFIEPDDEAAGAAGVAGVAGAAGVAGVCANAIVVLAAKAPATIVASSLFMEGRPISSGCGVGWNPDGASRVAAINAARVAAVDIFGSRSLPTTFASPRDDGRATTAASPNRAAATRA